MVPIFILPCSGRSGSTWLARLLTSSKEVLIWAETHLLSKRFEYLNNTVYAYKEDMGKTTDLHYFRKHGTTMWAAGLRPFEDDFNKHWALMMDNLFTEASHKEGYARWGVKEVDWAISDLYFIRNHWEDYRVIFLIRNFLDCYRSAVGTGWLSGETGKIWFIQEWLRMGSQIHLNQNVHGKEAIFKYENLNKIALANWCNITLAEDLPYVGSSSKYIDGHDWKLISGFLDSINALSIKLGYWTVDQNSLFPEEKVKCGIAL